MSHSLKNIYTHLIQNRKHQLFGWYEKYKCFTEDIDIIRRNLNLHELRSKETYIGTSYQNRNNPFGDFIYQLLFEQANGISSRGQSVLSWVNLDKFINAQGFDDVFKNLILENDLTSYERLKAWWVAQATGNNPLLINRAIAACGNNLSSTVDEAKFNQIFYWLQKENLIAFYPKEEPQDWYSKNVFAMQQITAGLVTVPAIDKYWISIFIWEMFVYISNPFSLKKQVVKYGSPGTGKTYIAKQNTKLLFEIWKDEFTSSDSNFDVNNHIEIVQFHPSYTYEDFLEGLRPKLDDNQQAQLALQNGVFKEFCIKAGRWECDIEMLLRQNPDLKNITTLCIKHLEKFKNILNGEYWEYIFNVTDKDKKLIDAIPPYFFIVDEINRAELSRVFGELMYCLEYRGIEGSIKTQYAHLNNEETGMIKVGAGYQFFIPKNVFLIGTMNTIDRSVESFDFALRRRFKWEEVMPDISLLYYHLMQHNPKWILLAENLKKLNAEVESEPLLGRDFQIGHAYLWDLHYPKELTVSEVRKAIWDDSIAPLLQEYLRGTGRDILLLKFATSFGLS